MPGCCPTTGGVPIGPFRPPLLQVPRASSPLGLWAVAPLCCQSGRPWPAPLKRAHSGSPMQLLGDVLPDTGGAGGPGLAALQVVQAGRCESVQS